MKHLYITAITLVLTVSVFGQMGQIMNGGFENWSNTAIYDYPDTWGNSNSDEWKGQPCVIQSTDAQNGNYSCELTSVTVGPAPDTLFGYVYQGTVGQTGPNGGIAYTAPFDEVRFQYKSSMTTSDTLYLIYIRFIASTPVEMNVFPAVYSTAGSWTQGSVSIPAGTQDELFIGFVMGDPFNQIAATPGAWVRLDNVEMYNLSSATTPLPDPSFESWSTQSVETPDNWFTLDEMLAGSGLENANKTTDAYAGTYAMELSTLQNPTYGDTINGFFSMGPFNFSGMNPFIPVPYNANPTTFSGAYKYSPVNGDMANIQIVFLQGGNPIGSLNQPLTAAASYTTFSSPLTIAGTPDSIVFVVFSGNNPGSALKLDELSFSGGNVGLEEFQSMSVNIYPNPANDFVMVKAEGNYQLSITDMTGKMVYTAENLSGAQQIDLSAFENGNYIIQISNDHAVEKHYLSVQ